MIYIYNRDGQNICVSVVFTACSCSCICIAPFMLTVVEFVTRGRENLETLANFYFFFFARERSWMWFIVRTEVARHLLLAPAAVTPAAFPPLRFIYRTCRGPTCPPGSRLRASHQRISPLPPQLHRVASLVCFARKVDSFDSWLLPARLSCHSVTWLLFFFFYFLRNLTSIFSSASPSRLLTISTIWAECHVWVTTCLSI